MQSEYRDRAYLWDILEAARDIIEFIQDLSFDQFAVDKKTRFAVERQLLAIGEAANHVSDSFRKLHPEIPWKQIIGQRNVIAYEYGEVLVERIWFTAKENIPELIENVQKNLPDNEY